MHKQFWHVSSRLWRTSVMSLHDTQWQCCFFLFKVNILYYYYCTCCVFGEIKLLKKKSALLAICAGTGLRWIPRTKASDVELWSFFDLRLNTRLSKQSWRWWFQTLSRPLWRHCNDEANALATNGFLSQKVSYANFILTKQRSVSWLEMSKSLWYGYKWN